MIGVNMKDELEKTLDLFTAVGLAITIVVGSGLLILPGLAYIELGSAAIYAWVISAVVSIPLLIVFAKLGAESPGAGGIAGFMQSAFSRRMGAATEILILGSIPGGAALAITGGNYLSALLNDGQLAVILGTLLVLLTGGAVNYFGAKVSGRVQQILAAVLVILLAGVAVSALILGDPSQGEGIAPVSQAMDTVPSVALVYFAFIGWEMMSFTTEEFDNPERDFPLMIAISFLIVVALYLLVAFAFQRVVPRTHPELASAPISAMLSTVFGSTSGKVISFLGTVIVLANFIGGVWAFSRLIFSSAREGLLPAFLADVEERSGAPRNAVIASVIASGVVTVFVFFGILSQAALFELAGISFFLSYLLATIAFIKISESLASKIFGSLTLIGVGTVFLSFGVIILYPLLLFILGFLITGRREGD